MFHHHPKQAILFLNKATNIRTHVKQIAKFGAVGVINTLGDFLLFNVLFGLLHLPLLLANICAVSVMMLISLQLNRRFVFQATDASYGRQMTRFLLVTLFGLYVIQNIIMFTVLGMLETASLSGVLASDIILANIAKAVGVAGSATWNFILYKLWVFKKPAEIEKK